MGIIIKINNFLMPNIITPYLLVIVTLFIFANSLEEMSMEITQQGDGKTFPKKNDMIHAHYRGTLQDGTEFDSSYGRNEPLEFNVGVGMVIKCWDDALLKMSIGEKAKLVCPPHLAYGDEGA